MDKIRKSIKKLPTTKRNLLRKVKMMEEIMTKSKAYRKRIKVIVCSPERKRNRRSRNKSIRLKMITWMMKVRKKTYNKERIRKNSKIRKILQRKG